MKWRAGSNRAQHFRTAIFLLSDGQSTTQSIPSFTKLNYLTIDVLWSMMVLIFIVFGLAEVDDSFFLENARNLILATFGQFLSKMAKMSVFKRDFSTTRAPIVLKLGNQSTNAPNNTLIK